MKKFLLLALFGLFSLTFVGCEEPEMKTNSIEEEETFEASLTVNVSYDYEASMPKSKTPGFETADPFTPSFPSTFKAYFVSNETTGDFLKGQLVKTVDVTEGKNKIDSLPKMSYTVYVTNYVNPDDAEWYMKKDSWKYLPIYSHEIYVLGESLVNYNEISNGTINIKNTYACIQILKSEYISYAFGVYRNEEEEEREILYFDGNNDWYVIYQRTDPRYIFQPLSFIVVHSGGGNGTNDTYYLPLKDINVVSNINVWAAHHKRGGTDGFDYLYKELDRRD